MIDARPDESEVLAAVSRVLRGDNDAFGIIVDRYQRIVYRLSFGILGSPEEAEDATQEVFLRVYGALGKFRLDRRFHPWLYTIAVNHLRSRRKRVIRWESRRQPAVEPDTLSAPAPEDPLAEVQRARIRDAVASLPSNLREAVVLYYLEGLDTTEAAEVLGIGVENVKSRLHRGRAKLRGLLGEEERG